MPDEELREQNSGDRKRRLLPKRFVSLYEIRNRKRGNKITRDDKGMATLANVVATIAIALATMQMCTISGEQRNLLTAANTIIDGQLKVTENAFISEARAWIAPQKAKWAPSFEVKAHEHANIMLEVKNPGHEVAMNVFHRFREQTVVVPRNGQGEVWFETPWPENRMCPTAETTRRVVDPRHVIFPTGEGDAAQYLLHTFNGPGVPADLFEPVDLRQAPHRSIYVEGCFAYETAGLLAWTQYCFLLRPEPKKAPGDWSFISCPAGNDAGHQKKAAK